MILLSDGLNTQNRYSNSASQIDARQKILCDNAKAAGIHDLYGPCQYRQPARPDVGGAAILRQQPENFFLVTAASQTVAAFKSIGASPSKLRVAR